MNSGFCLAIRLSASPCEASVLQSQTSHLSAFSCWVMSPRDWTAGLLLQECPVGGMHAHQTPQETFSFQETGWQ